MVTAIPGDLVAGVISPSLGRGPLVREHGNVLATSFPGPIPYVGGVCGRSVSTASSTPDSRMGTWISRNGNDTTGRNWNRMQLWTRNVRRVGISTPTARAPATHLVAVIERGGEVAVFEVAVLLSWHGAGEDLVAAALVGGGGEVVGGRDAGGRGGGRREGGGGSVIQ